jgi:cytochrome P450
MLDLYVRAYLSLRLWSLFPRAHLVHREGWTDTVTSLMPYGERWRDHRRMLHRTFNLTLVSAYNSTQTEHMRSFLHKLYTSPKDFERHIQQCVVRHALFLSLTFPSLTSSLAVKVAYGHQIAEKDDPLASMAVEAVEFLLNSVFPGALAVNAIPARKPCYAAVATDTGLTDLKRLVQRLPEWFPGTGFQKYARECRELLRRLRCEPFDRVKELMVSGHSIIVYRADSDTRRTWLRLWDGRRLP